MDSIIAQLFYFERYSVLCYFCAEYATCPVHPTRQLYLEEETCDVLARPSQIAHRSLFQYKSSEVDGELKRVTRTMTKEVVEEHLTESNCDLEKQEKIPENVIKKEISSKEKKDVTAFHNAIRVFYVAKKSAAPQIKVKDLRNRKKNQRFRMKKYICDICENAFTLKQNVQTHIFAYHLGNHKIRKGCKRFQCTICDATFKKLPLAKKHYICVHKGETSMKKINDCPHCGKVYPTGSLLREHITTKHLNEKPFDCEKCGAKFGRKGGLRRHVMMVHENYTYNCPYEDCNHPGYKCSKALAAHIRSVHTKEQPYVCSICKRGFVRQNDLKVHEATHGLGGFSCEYCTRTFSRRKDVQRHMERAH
ncbi:unnamed protein product [Bursaphelenchus xylophilus]|uniref:(pine wood nematode) hypothetical protein n=1 Tax=Bursaphelenchus xylophilus TaxID=6326 RepID=A0A1I7RPZ0_BURXY|nr:unnamed protein product [Bursaphelenchus xylophilus]CAG9096855.1 unnamed protein product [Bursaphelenchus xylophilus]